MKDRCYDCGNVRCKCKLPRISIVEMKKRVHKAFIQGFKHDKDACTYEELAALLRMIPPRPRYE